MTHDHKRNGTTTLFAALNVLEGSAIGRCMQRRTHQEFIGFLNAIENQVPATKQVLSGDIRNPFRGDTENPVTAATATRRRMPVRVLP